MHLYLCDIDGTIANNLHREHLAKAKDWDAFFDACDKDEPIVHMRTLLCNLAMVDAIRWDDQPQIAYVSGRPERTRDKTVVWLDRHGFPQAPLYMRNDGDHRPDHVIKAELLEIVRANVGEPLMVFDDRNSVVRMWRELGIPCLQCAEGDF